MLALRAVQSLRTQITSQLKRNICVSAVLSQKATESQQDLIQQLFVTKVREYAQKSKAAGGKPVDPSPAAVAQLEQEMEKLAVQYNVKGQDPTKFPTFEFADKDLQPVYSDANFLDMFEGKTDALVEEVEEDDDEPFFTKHIPLNI